MLRRSKHWRRRALGHAQQFICGFNHIARLLARCLYENRHCERSRARCTAVMRHYLRIGSRMPASPSLLTRSVLMRPAAGVLIPGARTAKRCGPRLLSAPLGAVHVAMIAIAADAHLHPAARARILPVALRSRRTQHATQQWTNPCSARITLRRISPARHRTEGPGSDRQIFTRAFISIRVAQRIADISSRTAQPRRDRFADINTLGKPLTLPSWTMASASPRPDSFQRARQDSFWKAPQRCIPAGAGCIRTAAHPLPESPN